MKNNFLSFCLLILCLAVLSGCSRSESAPLRLLSAHLIDSGQERELELDLQHRLIVPEGLLRLVFNRPPKEHELASAFQPGIPFAVSGNIATIDLLHLSPGELSWGTDLTGKAGLGSIKVYQSTGKRTLALVSAEISVNSHTWQIPGAGHYEIPDHGLLRLRFNESLNTELLPLISGASTSVRDGWLQIALNPEVSEVRLSDNLLDIHGNPLKEEYLLSFTYLAPAVDGRLITIQHVQYPWLVFDEVSDISYGQALYLNLHWPFPKSEVERFIKGSMPDGDYDLHWENNSRLRLTIHNLPQGGLYLDFRGISDSYGHYHPLYNEISYSVRVRPNRFVKEVSLEHKSNKLYPIAIPISGALKISKDFSTATLYRFVYHYGDYGGTWQYMQFRLSDGTLSEEGKIGSSRYYPYRNSAEAIDILVRNGKDKNAIEAWAAGISPSGRIAVLRNGDSENEAVIDLFDAKLGLTRSYPVTISPAPYEDWEYEPRVTDIVWSWDENVLYFALNFNTIMLDLGSGGTDILPSVSEVVASLTQGNLLVKDNIGDYFLQSPDGDRTRLGTREDWVHVGAIVDSNSFLLNAEGNSYLYDLTTHTKELISAGLAFGYDPNTRRVFLLTMGD